MAGRTRRVRTLVHTMCANGSLKPLITKDVYVRESRVAGREICPRNGEVRGVHRDRRPSASPRPRSVGKVPEKNNVLLRTGRNSRTPEWPADLVEMFHAGVLAKTPLRPD
jgi:hypothetical protein